MSGFATGYDGLEGCAALGGLSTMSSPRGFMLRVNTVAKKFMKYSEINLTKWICSDTIYVYLKYHPYGRVIYDNVLVVFGPSAM